ncbi:hypothetical protein C2S52_021413 [Perilla frutescens var. hirtella]|nr:hypothetical protein C2S52_021413 [Perilla frutescens var. hirtella]KAH6808345.1 hypothetical protein C2S51_029453 [Perilla frutescens var. frutescens]
MAGQGGVPNGALSPADKWDGIIPPECQSNSAILRLNPYNMKWEEAHEPLHGNGIGPGMPFANSLLKRDPSIGVIGLVPTAYPGSYIDSWSRVGKHYINMLAMARAAVADGGVLRGFLWYQGESDSKLQSDVDLYKGKLVDLFNNVRADLQSPSLQIIEVALASGFNFTESIRQIQLHIEVPNVKVVDAAGLEILPPNCLEHNDQRHCLHISTAAQVKLGTMLADAFLQC